MPVYLGVYPAQVIDIKDPDKRGRIRVKCPEVLEDEVSAWCEPGYSYTRDYGGDFCIPSLGEWVWVTFQEGDLDMPVYLGGWWQEKKTPIGDADYYKLVDKVRIINFHNMNVAFDRRDNSIKVNTYDPETLYETELNIKPTKLTISVTVVDGTVEFTVEDGKITINGDVLIKGNVTIKEGSLDVVDKGIHSKGVIKADSDIQSDRVSMDSHTHTQTTSGITTSPN